MGLFKRKKQEPSVDINALVQSKVAEVIAEKKGYYSDEQVSNFQNAFLVQMYTNLGNANQIMPFSSLKEEKARELFYDIIATPDKSNFVVSSIINQLSDSAAQIIDFAELLDKDNQMIDKHPAIDLLNNPNDRYTKKAFMKDVMKNYLSQGEAFIYGTDPRIRAKGQKFYSMYCVPSHIVDIISQGLVKPIAKYKLTKKLYSSNGPQMTPENTMHWFEPNVNPDSMHGLSKLVGVYKEIQILQKAKERQQTLNNNGGPAKIVTPKQLSDLPMTPAQQEVFEKMANDSLPSRKTKVLNTPIEIHDLGASAADMQLIETNKEQVIAICNAFNFPVDLLYGNATYHNFKEASAYKVQSVIPIVNAFLESYSVWTGVTKEGLHFELNEDKIGSLISDKLDKINKMKQAGIFTTNELRDVVDYEPLQEEDADKVPIPLTQAYLGEELIEPIDEQNQ